MIIYTRMNRYYMINETEQNKKMFLFLFLTLTFQTFHQSMVYLDYQHHVHHAFD
jgi:hypothetical protein